MKARDRPRLLIRELRTCQMKIWIFLIKRPADDEPTPCMYWGNSSLASARRMVETWPYRVSDAHEIDVEPSKT